MTSGAASGAARFLFATEDGTISGWNPNVPAPGSTQAIVAGSHAKSIYKGLAIATWNGADYLYATDFHSGRVDVYDSTFTRKHWDGAFRDRHLPKHYAPFGIQAVNGMIFVTYASQDAAREDEIAGTGKGFVDVFTPRGKLLGRVASRGALNAPWGIAWAPATGFGRFSGDLLVGNFGDGRINALPLASRASGISMARSGRPTARRSRSTACGGSASATTPQPDLRPPSTSPRARTTSPTAHSGPSGRPETGTRRGSTRRVAGRSPVSSCIRIATQPRRRRCRTRTSHRSAWSRCPEPIPQPSQPREARRPR